ncbi:hypothetical protein [Flavisolibacter nicotianae]|uniref:hypothetical protein n=1 Tax=Flavisolibacter nicotianae TaxID=2364882 RepID=UPI000EB217A8|nr:hypothetical protein [Flavisolibacter nicotianae]
MFVERLKNKGTKNFGEWFTVFLQWWIAIASRYGNTSCCRVLNYLFFLNYHPLLPVLLQASILYAVFPLHRNKIKAGRQHKRFVGPLLFFGYQLPIPQQPGW